MPSDGGDRTDCGGRRYAKDFFHEILFVFADAAADGFAEGFADGVDGDAVEDLLEEASDDHASGFLAGQAAALGVEDHFVVNTAGGGTVRAADIVGFDFRTGYGVARA